MRTFSRPSASAQQAGSVRPQRLLKIAALLQSGPGWTSNALAERFNVCRRTIFRDLQLLRQAEFAVEVDETLGGYRVASNREGPAPRFEVDELVALVQAIRRSQLPESMSRICQRLIAKVFSAADPTVRSTAENLIQHSRSA